jgi:hypothetical protein
VITPWAIAPPEELLERENLPAITQGALGDQPQFGEGIDHYALGLQLVDGGNHRLGGFAQLEFGGIEDRQLCLGRQVMLGRDQLCDRDAGHIPAMAAGDFGDFSFGFGEGDIQACLTRPHALNEKLNGERGLPGSGGSTDKVKTIRRETAAEDVVDARDAAAEGRHI